MSTVSATILFCHGFGNYCLNFQHHCLLSHIDGNIPKYAIIAVLSGVHCFFLLEILMFLKAPLDSKNCPTSLFFFQYYDTVD